MINKIGKYRIEKLAVLLLFLAVFLFSLTALASGGGLGCYITDGECDEDGIAVLYLSNDTGGYTNAHAELPSEASYSYKVCCNFTGATIGTECDDTASNAFLKLSDTTNAHVQQPSVDTYAEDACINVSGNGISCLYPEDSCAAGYECVVSMASDGESNTTNAHVGSCTAEYDTRVCCKSTTPPTISDVMIFPDPSYTGTAVKCNATVADLDDDQITINFTWYNGTAEYSSELIDAGTGGTNTSSLLPIGTQSKWEVWNCTAFATADGASSSIKSDKINITNTLPAVPTLLIPTDENYTFRDRTPAFDWSDSTDADADSITYEINITSETGCGGDRYVQDIEGSTYTPTSELCTNDEPAPGGGTVYEWNVRACDDVGCSAWTETFNFSIEPYVIINVTRDEVDFGSVTLSQINDTTDDDPLPFLMRNDGNVIATLVNVSSNMSLWRSSLGGLGTKYFQIMAGVAEEGSFDEGESQMSWINVTLYNQTLVKDLDYNDSKDTAELEVRIEVPADEPPGTRLSYLIFSWEQSS